MTLTNALNAASRIAIRTGDDAIILRALGAYEARERLPFDRLSDSDIVALVGPDGRLTFDHGDAS